MKEISLRRHMVCIYNPADVRPQNARERQDQIWPRGMHKILPWLSVLVWQIEDYLWHIVQILTHTWRPGTPSHSSVSPSPLSAVSLTSSPPVSRRGKAGPVFFPLVQAAPYVVRIDESSQNQLS